LGTLKTEILKPPNRIGLMVNLLTSKDDNKCEDMDKGVETAIKAAYTTMKSKSTEDLNTLFESLKGINMEKYTTFKTMQNEMFA